MNVLFILADQWRGECLSVFDHDHVRTPHLDALAADGVAFSQHYAQATPCGPSRASVYTGMYLHNHRSLVNGTPLDARHTNVAMEARNAGYDPALIGYTDVSLDPRHYENKDGYEGVLPGLNPVCQLTGAHQPWLDDLKAKGYDIPDDPKDMLRPVANFPGAEDKGPTYAPTQCSADDSITAFAASETIKHISANRDRPWFAHVSFLSPHPPFIVPEPYHDMYDADDMPMPRRQATPELESEQHPWVDYFIHHQSGSGYTVGVSSVNNLSLSDRDTRQIKATYYAMIAEVDAQVGRLIDHLKSENMYDDTLIVFTSDHGEHMGDHWMYAKYSYYQQTFHIPMIVRDPTAAADAGRGTIVDKFTENVDVMPTILDSLNIDIPAQCDGHSVLPFCHGSTPDNWRNAYHSAFDMRGPVDDNLVVPLGLAPEECVVQILCDERYKYVHFASLPPLLFDLKNDPDEFNNLANDPGHQALVLEYAQKMLSWRLQQEAAELTNLHLTNDGVSNWA
jgi:arylsulfatase A-like enzyme